MASINQCYEWTQMAELCGQSKSLPFEFSTLYIIECASVKWNGNAINSDSLMSLALSFKMLFTVLFVIHLFETHDRCPAICLKYLGGKFARNATFEVKQIKAKKKKKNIEWHENGKNSIHFQSLFNRCNATLMLDAFSKLQL